MLMARRLRVLSARNVVIVAHAVKARASTHLTRSVRSIRIGHAAKVVRAMVLVKAAIIKAINLPS
jgi:F0F1-type ATP synthase assembly protein I